jgi:uncharacterized tellurite resistance protein B-like protein
MIGRLRALLRGLAESKAAVDPDRVPLAMTALLVEAARADHNVKQVELEELGRLIAGRLDIGAEEAASLVHRARAAVEGSVSLYEFTQPLQQMSYEQKQEFVRMLWDVALADRRLDGYEEYLVSKVSELLYVARGDVLRLRHEVLKEKPAALGGD